MEYLLIILLIVIVYFSIKDLRKYKKLPNENSYNILQNSRHFRLLAIVVASIIGVIIFIFKKIMN
jgi:hypothetical protein